MSIGKRLMKARKALGLSLDDIKDKSKIRRSYLKAIEEDNFDKLPGEVYTKVYIRGYAKIVNLDPQELLAEYDSEKSWDKNLKEDKPKKRKKEQKEKGEDQDDLNLLDKVFKILFVITIILIIVLLSYNLFFRTDQSVENNVNNQNIEVTVNNSDQQTDQNDSNTNSNNMKESEEESNQEDTDNLNNTQETEIPDIEVDQEQDTDNNADQEIEQLVQDQTKELKILASEKSWLQVIVDGDTMFQGFINKDEEMTHNGTQNIRIKIGNAAAVQIEYEGETLGPFGKSGEVVIREFELN